MAKKSFEQFEPANLVKEDPTQDGFDTTKGSAFFTESTSVVEGDSWIVEPLKVEKFKLPNGDKYEGIRVITDKGEGRVVTARFFTKRGRVLDKDGQLTGKTITNTGNIVQEFAKHEGDLNKVLKANVGRRIVIGKGTAAFVKGFSSPTVSDIFYEINFVDAK